MTVTETQILDVLRKIAAPGGGDIVARQMVTGLVVKGGNVGFSIEVDPKQGAQLEPLRQAAERAVDQIPGVTSATVVLTAHKGTHAHDHAHDHNHDHGHAHDHSHAPAGRAAAAQPPRSA